MSNTVCALAVVATLLFAPAAFSAAPDSGTTAICKDGSQYTGFSKRGACSRHGGVQQWLDTASAQTAQQQPNNTPAAPTVANPPPPAAVPQAPVPQTAGVNPSVAANAGNQVWVNLNSKVYHCAGDRFYGKTKKGEFLSESQAVAQGFRPDHGKACGHA